MSQDRESAWGAAPAGGPRYIDGVLYDGVDHAAAHRAHARALTTARQAAERGHGGQAEPGADRAAAFRDEMARIDAEHRAWLLERGEEVLGAPPRTRRRSATPSRVAGAVADPDPRDDRDEQGGDG